MKVKTSVKAGDHCRVAWDELNQAVDALGQCCKGDPASCLKGI
jgi:hypothetical protein